MIDEIESILELLREAHDESLDGNQIECRSMILLAVSRIEEILKNQ